MHHLNYKKLFSYYTDTEHAPELFLLLNELFFDGELPPVDIRFQNLKLKEDPDSIYVNGEFRMHETETGNPTLYLDPSSILSCLFSNNWNRSFHQLCGHMVHEMVHYYCTLNHIPETDNHGVFHNRNFRDAAQAHGLTATYSMSDPMVDGYNSTALTGWAEALIDRNIGATRKASA